MAKQIKRTDIVEKDIFKNLIDSADASITKLKLMNDQFVTMAKTIKTSMKTAKFDTTKELNEFIKVTKTATTLTKEQAKAMQELEKANALKAKAQQELIRVEKEELKLKDQALRSARTKATDDEKQLKIDARKQKSLDDEANAYKRLEKNTRDLKNQSKQLGATLLELERDGKKNTKEFTDLERKFKDVTRQAQTGDQALKKLDKTVGDNFRNVGNYSSGLDKLRSGLGSLGIAFGIGTVVRSAGKTILDFDHSIADLVSITGASGKDLEFYKEKAIELGKGVEGGAKNVIEAYKLIGSAKPELLANAEGLNMVTESAIKLSHASGMELPDAATKLTDAMNQFNAPAEKAGEFINVLANGALFGAAEIPQVTASLLEFGAVARTSNVSIQESTALIEMLASKGIKGAQAGTALRNVMLKLSAPDALPKKARDYLAEMGVDMAKLSDTSVPFAERLQALTPILNNEAAQVKMFGLENVVAAKNLLLNVDGIKELTKQMETKGTADVQAEARTQTLTQSLIELQGSWEAWILGINEGTGASNSMRDAIDFLAKNLSTILNLVVTLTEIWVKYKIITLGQVAVNKLMASSFVTTMRSAESLGGVMKGLGGLVQKVGTAIKNNLAGIALYVIANVIMKYKELNDIYAIGAQNAEELANAQNDIATNLKKETIEAGALFDALKKTNNGSVERSNLITEINNKYGTTLENLKDEKKFVDQVNTSYNDLIASMTAKAEMEGVRIKFEMSQNQLAKAEMDYQQAMDNYNEYIYNATAGSRVLDDLLTHFGVTSESDLQDIMDAYFNVYASATKQADIYKDDFIKAQSKIALSKKQTTKEIVEGGNKTVYSTKKETTAVKELDTTFKELNKTLSEQASLLNELDNIYKNRAIDLKTDEAKAEYDKQVKIATEFGLKISGLNDKGAVVEGIKTLLEEETDLKTKQAEFNLKFKIDQLEKEYIALVAAKQKELDLEKIALLGQKDLTPEARAKIEANYVIKQKELDADLAISKADMKSKEIILTENTADSILTIEKEKSTKIKEYSEGVYDAAKTHGENLTAAAEKNATDQGTIDDKALAKRKQYFDDLNKLAQMSSAYFIKQSDKRIAQIDIELDALTKQKNFLEQMAVNGNITAEKSLVQNEKLTAEYNKKKAKEIKKQERIKLAESVFTSYTANVANKEKSPIIKTISDISVLTAFINSLPTFYKGTERTVGESLGMPQLSGRDGHIVRVDGSEKILNPTLSKMTGNMTTLEIAQLAEDKLRGKIMSKGGSTIQILENNYSNDILVEKLDQLNNTILNKPEMNVEVGQILGGVMHVVESTKNTRQTVRNITRFS